MSQEHRLRRLSRLQWPGPRDVGTHTLLWIVLSLPLPLGASGLLGSSGDSLASTGGWAWLMALVVGLSWAAPPVAVLVSAAATLFNPWFADALLVTSYLMGLRLARTGPAAAAIASIIIGGVMLTSVVPEDISLVTWAANVAILLVTVVVPWVFGRYWRQHREIARVARERAELLEREQEIVAKHARLRERTRIAEDMHDSLGHELSLVALRAGGLEVASGLEAQHRAAAAELRSVAASATERLHEIVGVLRDDSGAAPMATVDESVAEVVARAQHSGMAVELQSTGNANARLAPLVERAAHHVVQESLTNAMKHAPGARVAVRFAHTTTETVVTITNEAPRSDPQPAGTSGNLGLASLRERVRLVGGTLEAGACDAGFEVVARLPHDAAGTPPYSDDAIDKGQPTSVRESNRMRRRIRGV